MRRARLRLCSTTDYNSPRGPTSTFQPKYRPRRLIMPIDPSEAHNDSRLNPFTSYQRRQERLQKLAKKKGAITLGRIPQERTVADCFGFVLNYCKERGLLSVSRTDPMARSDDPNRGTGSSSSLAGAAHLLVKPNEVEEDSITVPDESYKVWDILSRTPLPSPVHGMLAVRGEALVKEVVLDALYREYPRLRCQHANHVLAQCCGLLACNKIAKSIGLTHVCQLDSEVDLWREWSFGEQRLEFAEQELQKHQEYLEMGLGEQQWYFERRVSQARRKLRSLQVRRDTLRPYVEWTRDLLFAFVAFVQRSQGTEVAERFIRRVFCRDLAFPGEVPQREEEHPLNAMADRAQLVRSSSLAQDGSEPLVDPFVSDLEARNFPDVPELVRNAVNPSNALMEAQIVLKYEPSVPKELRELSTKALDFEHLYTDHPVMETQSLNEYQSQQQQHRAPKTMRMRLVLGGKQGVLSPKNGGGLCVGVGNGETVRHAMDSACRDMLFSYYFRGKGKKDSEASDKAQA